MLRFPFLTLGFLNALGGCVLGRSRFFERVMVLCRIWVAFGLPKGVQNWVCCTRP